MKFTATAIAGIYVVEMLPVSDSRGWFARSFCKKEFEQIGHHEEWVQMNHSFTSTQGSIRGMHFQNPPHQEIKMVRCIAGAVFDVVVDLRKGSPTFLQWIGIELSAGARNMLYIPKGIAHGFQSLTDNAELLYHHSSYYTTGAEGGILFNDKFVGIKWPLAVSEISERDLKHAPLTKDFKGIEA